MSGRSVGLIAIALLFTPLLSSATRGHPPAYDIHTLGFTDATHSRADGYHRSDIRSYTVRDRSSAAPIALADQRTWATPPGILIRQSRP